MAPNTTTEYQANKARSNIFKRVKQPKGSREHVGKKLECKVFYETNDDDGNPVWVEYAPPALTVPKKTKFEGAAIQIYKKEINKLRFANVAEYTVSTLKLQSPFLRDALRPILEKQGLEFEEEHVCIDRPFKALFFERHRIQELTTEVEDPDTREHLELLCRIINEELGSVIDEYEELMTQGKITYDLLWTLFPLELLAVGKDGYHSQGCRVKSTTNYGYYLEVGAEYASFNGLQFGLEASVYRLAWFEGSKNIVDLEVCPLSMIPSPEALRAKLVKRGENVLRLQGIHYMQYGALAENGSDVSGDGPAQSLQGGGDPLSRIIIDSHSFYMHGSGYRPSIKPFKQYDSIDGGKKLSDWAQGVLDIYSLDTKVRRMTKEEFDLNSEVVKKDVVNLFLMQPALRGFSLASKTWRTFDVDLVKELEPNELALDYLVLDERAKDLVLTLSQGHQANSFYVDDFITGKGRGLLFLLSGPPGTGKTLLAESVADKLKRPLYYVNSQDLGEGPSAISRNLETILNQAADWNAILLLDEADLYLKERSSNRAEKNETVTVFLRHLEYYKGILFLTTNILGVIDQAVESRIHVHIKFSPLGHAARSTIWRNFLGRLSDIPVKITDGEIAQLARWNLNGRQIKNALFVTLSWCRQKSKDVTVETISEIIEMTCPKASRDDEHHVEGQSNGVGGGKSLRLKDNGEHLLDFD